MKQFFKSKVKKKILVKLRYVKIYQFTMRIWLENN